MSRVALIAGSGALPGLLAAALAGAGRPPLVARLEGTPVPEGEGAVRFRLERLVPFMDSLSDAGVTEVVFAGAATRPRIDPEAFDARTAQLVPRLLAAMGQGDDGALRGLVALFEEWGFAVLGADQVAPDLVPGPGVLTGAPGAADEADAARAAAIVAGLGALDLGQGAVVAQGLCLAVETLPGTDAMLAFAALHGPALRPNTKGARGVLYKAPKPGQDRRIDLPAIGPETVAGAARAGLAGIAWEAGGVLLLDRDATVAAAAAAGLFLWSRASDMGS